MSGPELPCPTQFFCPLTHQRLVEPMMAIDCGHHFERATIEAGIQQCGSLLCPFDGVRIDPTRMVHAREFALVMKQWDAMVTALLQRPGPALAGLPKTTEAAAPVTLVPANVMACWPGGLPQGGGLPMKFDAPLNGWPPGAKPGAISLEDAGLAPSSKPKAPRKPAPGALLPGGPAPGPGGLDMGLAGAYAGLEPALGLPGMMAKAARRAAPGDGAAKAKGGGGSAGGSTAGGGGDGSEDEPERAPIDPRKYKTRPCRNWAQTGQCSYEHTCCFAHGESELRDTIANMKILNSLGYFLNDADEMVKMNPDEQAAAPGGGRGIPMMAGAKPAAGRKGGAAGGGRGAGGRKGGSMQAMLGIHLSPEHLAALQ